MTDMLLNEHVTAQTQGTLLMLFFLPGTQKTSKRGQGTILHDRRLAVSLVDMLQLRLADAATVCAGI